MKHNVNFVLEKRKEKESGQLIVEDVPILAQITFAGNRIFYFTGYRIDADKFKNQEASKNSTGTEGKRIVQYNIINQRLKAIRAALELFFQPKETANKSDITALLDEICRKAKPDATSPDEVDFFAMFEKYAINEKISEGRRRNIKSIINHWRRYEAKRNINLSLMD